MSRPLPNAVQKFYNTSGVALAGGKLYSYAAGTLTPLVTYTDGGAGTPNANPTILDPNGHASIWITNAGYKFQLQDSLGNVIWTIDNVYLIEPNSITAAQIAPGVVGTAQFASNPIGTAQIAIGAITTLLFGANQVTTANFASGSVTFNKLDPAIDMSQLTNMAQVVFKRSDDLSGQKILGTPQYPWSAPTKLSNPLTLPPTSASDAKWSPDGKFLAVGSSLSPFITIYERTGTTLTKLADPGTLPAGIVNGVSWSPNGDFLACAHGTTPFMTVYQRQGINFTKLADPTDIPATRTQSCAFSPNGEFLLMQQFPASPIQGFVWVYQIKGTTFTQITGFSGNTFAAWSPDSQYIAVGTQHTNDIIIFQRLGANFTQVTGPATPANFPLDGAWSPDGQFLAVAGGVIAGVSIYQFSAGTFTLLAAPASIPTTALGISWSPDGNYLAVAATGTPYIYIYSRSGTTFTKLTDPVSLPPGDANTIFFSPTNQFVSVTTSLTPFVTNYQTAGVFPAKATLYARDFYV